MMTWKQIKNIKKLKLVLANFNDKKNRKAGMLDSHH